MDSFYKKISKDHNGCWKWIASKNTKGYGSFYYNKKRFLAHRASFEIHRYKIPLGLCVLHKCDNPSCVNPDHLFLGTHKDNADDMMNKNRGNMKPGENHFSAILKKEDIQMIFRLSANFSQREIAKKFNVAQCVIQNILNHNTWIKEGADLINLTPKGRRPNQNGSKNIRAKISENDAIKILQSKGLKSARELAIEFQVTEGSIRNIWSRKTWTHIKGD